MSTSQQGQQLFNVKLTSGELHGRFVGQNIAGLITKKTLHTDPPLRLNGFDRYMLYSQEDAGIRFIETEALQVQADLTRLGINSDLVIAT